MIYESDRAYPITIPISPALSADLWIPAHCLGIVIFAHGSGSSRHSPRNRYVASVLQKAGMATLLADLLTPEEETIDEIDRNIRFNIYLLADRLIQTSDWLNQHPQLKHYPQAYFGASTGAGAALVAAAQRPQVISAVVSRGGRVDLAGPALVQVQAPTLMIVGKNDPVVVKLNQDAMQQMKAKCQLQIIPGATHLFEEPGTLEQVADLVAQWLTNSYLVLNN